MAVDIRQVYDPNLDIWPDLRRGKIVLRPVRVGVNDRTFKITIGWDHVTQSMLKIFVTRFHERILRGYVGSFVPHLLGESFVMRAVTRFYWAIASAIDLWEPNFRIQRVRLVNRPDDSLLTSAEELRAGHLTTRMEGVYRPRAHVGDNSPERRRSIGLIGRGTGAWERAAF